MSLLRLGNFIITKESDMYCLTYYSKQMLFFNFSSLIQHVIQGLHLIFLLVTLMITENPLINLLPHPLISLRIWNFSYCTNK